MANPLQDLMAGLAQAGQKALELTAGKRREDIAALVERLMAEKGEASSIYLAQRIVENYAGLPADERAKFFAVLAADLAPSPASIQSAIERYESEPGPESVRELARATESPRLAFFRAVNMAPGGTAGIVSMRSDLLGILRDHPELRPVDEDLLQLLRSWFNRGFLVLERISWKTPAHILEKVIRYEAVHAFKGWEDLRHRLTQARAFYAYFHPALPDEPLIIVQVAFTQGIAASIDDILQSDQQESEDTAPERANTAVFYSISNCQPGLKGVSFGDFLIKHVTDQLAHDRPEIKRFATLSPIPGFRRWLDAASEDPELLSEEDRKLAESIREGRWSDDPETARAAEKRLPRLAAYYLLNAKKGSEPLDPVARFHLRNGASLARINWLADRSAKGMKQSAGMMVNYVYDPRTVAQNHESYVNEGNINCAAAISSLAKQV